MAAPAPRARRDGPRREGRALVRRSVSVNDPVVIHLAALIFFGLTSVALAQSGACALPPVTETGTPLKTCQVLRRGEVTGGLRWEMQERVYRPVREGSGDLVLRAMVVTERGEPVAWTEPGDGLPERPERLAARGGILLRLPVSNPGPMTQTRDEIWLRRITGGNWTRLDAQSWREEAERRLRPGETLAPTHRLDLRPLRAVGRIARAEDAPCCPRGGGYTAWLELGEDRLLLTGFSRR